MDEEALKRFLKETFGDALPEGALDGLDLAGREVAVIGAGGAARAALAPRSGENPIRRPASTRAT